MNTNDKTLAGVQPGGAVRLGDALLPCPFCGAPAERIDFGFGSGENEGGSCIACTVCQHSGPIEFGFKENFVSNWNRRAHGARQPAGHQHADDLAVDTFAAAMKAKMAAARAKGRAGWEDPEQCSADDLTRMLRDHVEKGDPRDVANFCMMLHQRREAIATDQQAHQEPVAVVGHDLTLHWAGKGSIAPLVKRHGIGPGSKLYSAPLAQAVGEESVEHACSNCDREHADVICPTCAGVAWDNGRLHEFHEIRELSTSLGEGVLDHLLPDEWHEKPLLRFQGAYDEGDDSVGISPRSANVLAEDQTGTVLGDYLAARAAKEGGL